MHQLIKKIQILKPEYDDLLRDLYGGQTTLERSLHDVSDLDFNVQYLLKYQQDSIPTRLDPLVNQLIDANANMRQLWYEFIGFLIKDKIGFDDTTFTTADIEDVFMKHISIDVQSVTIELGILSNNIDYLGYLDNKIPNDTPYKFYPTKFFRYHSEGYNEAIEKLYPELFSQRNELGSGTEDDHKFVHNFTFQTSEDCNLNCFANGTKILMSDLTYCNIEDIRVGDKIAGFNEFGIRGSRRIFTEATVTKTFQRMTSEKLYVISSSYQYEHFDSLIVTGNHPMLVNQGEWVIVEDLKSYRVKSPDLLQVFLTPFANMPLNDIGKLITSMSVNIDILPSEPTMVYNLETTSHTYVANNTLTHNCTYCVGPGTKITLADESIKNIEDIKVGDIVIAAEELVSPSDQRDRVMSQVVAVHEHDVNGIYEIVSPHLSTPLQITGSHPIFTWEGWVEVGKLTPSNHIMIDQFDPERRSSYTFTNEFAIHYMLHKTKVYNLSTTKRTYIANKLIVHNCYQMNKSAGRMTFDIAKTFIDNLLADNYGYINSKNSPALILEFIGGDPLLEMHLTRQIYEYFLDQAFKLDHHWFKFHRLSICSNGLLYFEDDVQQFFKDFHQKISFNISIDGNKKLHDSCRIQPNGEGSYDVDMVALNHYNANYSSERNSKMTLAPQNISYLFDSVVEFIKSGTCVINLNCVFEEVWSPETALIEYQQLKKLADYVIDNNLENLYIAIFSDNEDKRWGKEYDGNFCGGLL